MQFWLYVLLFIFILMLEYLIVNEFCREQECEKFWINDCCRIRRKGSNIQDTEGGADNFKIGGEEQ